MQVVCQVIIGVDCLGECDTPLNNLTDFVGLGSGNPSEVIVPLVLESGDLYCVCHNDNISRAIVVVNRQYFLFCRLNPFSGSHLFHIVGSLLRGHIVDTLLLG